MAVLIESRAIVKRLVPAVALLIGAWCGSAQAHHSFAMFDADKEVTLSGTVREFQFTNPHCWLQILVPQNGGASTAEWSIEMAAPAHLVRSGWTRSTVKPGDKITLIIHPLRDGSLGGSFISATDASGHAL